MKRNHLKTMGCLLLAMAMLLMPLGSLAEEAPYIHEEVVVGVASDPGSFNPYGAMNASRGFVMQGVFQTLITTNAMGGEIICELAESYEWISDKLLEVKVRQGVRDSAGNDFTANDVKFCYELSKEMGNKEAWNYLDSIEVIDDHTLRFHMNTNNLVAAYRTLRATMFTQKAWESSADKFATEPVGTGPYKLVDAISGSSYTFEYREDYWGNGLLEHANTSSHTVNRATYKVINDLSQMAIALETGEIDIAQTLGAADYANFFNLDDMTAYDGYIVTSSVAVAPYVLQFNCSEYSACDSALVRQAIAYCIDNEEVMNIMMSGMGETVTTVGIPSVMQGCDNEQLEADAQTNVYSQNIEKAKELLAEAGYADGLTLICMTNTEAGNVMGAQVVQAQCAQAGITIQLQQYDSSLYDTYRTDPSTGWDFQFTRWGDSTGYIAALWNLVFEPTGYGVYGNRCMVTAEEDPLMVELLNKTLSLDWTVEDCMAFHQYVCVDQCYMYAICAPRTYFVARDTVSKLVVGQGGDIAVIAVIYAE